VLAVSGSFAILVGFSEISEGFHVFVIPGFLALRHVKNKDGFTTKAGLFWD
jgi:competence protein ComGF